MYNIATRHYCINHIETLKDAQAFQHYKASSVRVKLDNTSIIIIATLFRNYSVKYILFVLSKKQSAVTYKIKAPALIICSKLVTSSKFLLCNVW